MSSESKIQRPKALTLFNRRDSTPLPNGVTALEWLSIKYFFDNGFNKTRAYNSACVESGNDTLRPKSRQAAHNLFARPRVIEFISKELALLDVTKLTIAARLDAMFEQDFSEAIIIKKKEVGKDAKGNPIYKKIGKDEEGNTLYEETFEISLSKIKELGLFHMIKKLKQGANGEITIEFHQQRRKDILDSMAKLQGYMNEAPAMVDTSETPMARFNRMLQEARDNGHI